MRTLEYLLFGENHAGKLVNVTHIALKGETLTLKITPVPRILKRNEDDESTLGGNDRTLGR